METVKLNVSDNQLIDVDPDSPNDIKSINNSDYVMLDPRAWESAMRDTLRHENAALSAERPKIIEMMEKRNREHRELVFDFKKLISTTPAVLFEETLPLHQRELKEAEVLKETANEITARVMADYHALSVSEITDIFHAREHKRMEALRRDTFLDENFNISVQQAQDEEEALRVARKPALPKLDLDLVFDGTVDIDVRETIGVTFDAASSKVVAELETARKAVIQTQYNELHPDVPAGTWEEILAATSSIDERERRHVTLPCMPDQVQLLSQQDNNRDLPATVYVFRENDDQIAGRYIRFDDMPSELRTVMYKYIHLRQRLVDDQVETHTLESFNDAVIYLAERMKTVVAHQQSEAKE